MNTAKLSDAQKIAFFDILNSSLDIGVSILDDKSRYVYINDHAYDQLGVTRSELKPGDTLEHLHALMCKNGLLNEEIIKSSYQNMPKDDDNGAQKTTQPLAVKLANGRTHALMRKQIEDGMTMSVSHDISSLVEKDEILEQALHLGKSAYWIYDLSTKHYHLSQSIRKAFPEELLSQVKKMGITALVHPDDREAFTTALKSTVKNKGGFEVRHRSARSLYQQNDIFCRTTGELVRDETGKPIKIRAFIRDISQQHEQEIALEQAKDHAIAASKAKSEFLANMSHEIRTPMNGVLGMAELLDDSELTPRQRDYVKVITRSSEALLTIINDILDFSKIEADAFELDPISFNLRDAIDDVMALLAIHAHDKGLELIVDYTSDIPRGFIGDVGRIRQVITNLIGNAIKFTDSGHIVITVKAKPTDTGDARVIVSVEDTGIGIAPEKIDAVFSKFTQADGSTTRVYGGTGLGLSIARRIIQFMDGDITVESTVGVGSKFTFDMHLPVDTSVKSTPVDKSALVGLKALIVDDIDFNRDILSERFSSWGMESHVVADGMSALIALQNAQDSGAPFHIAIIDYMMPGMNGLDLASLIASNKELSDIPLVMLSSCGQDINSEALRKVNIVSNMSKPVREKQLLEVLCEVVANTSLSTSINNTVKIPPLSDGSARPPIAQSQLANAAIKDIEATLATVKVNRPNTVKVHSEPALAGSATQTLNLLVAEDFPLNQEVVALMLDETPYKCIFAANGQEAVDLYKEDPASFSAVLMDISMPVMDGYEAAEIIKAHQAELELPYIPIIALTGHALKHDREKCLDADMDDYLTKPVKQNELLGSLDEWVLGKARAGLAKTA